MSKRLGTMILCITAVVALFAVAAVPAFAGSENGNAYGHDKQDEENFQQADSDASEESSDESSTEASSTEESSADEPAPAPRGSSKKSTRSSSTSSSSDTQSADSSSTQSSSTSGSEDTGHKAYQPEEGAYRGQSSSSCTNTNTGNFSGSGANHHGPYDTTCDGTASRNGNGGGTASGRPCAGCVGNADNKNPKGQYSNGNHDGNAGYECDGNNGIGRSNPAHTACKPPTLTPMCPTNSSLPVGDAGCSTPPEIVCPTDMSIPPGAAGCNPPPRCPTDMSLPLNHPDCNEDEDDVLGRDDEATPGDSVLGKVIHNAGPVVAAAGEVAPEGAVLPFTGSADIYAIVSLGMLLIAAGTVGLKLRKQS